MIVARTDYVTAAFAEYAKIVTHFLTDILDRTERERLLIVNRTVKYQFVTEISF